MVRDPGDVLVLLVCLKFRKYLADLVGTYIRGPKYRQKVYLHISNIFELV